MDIWKSKVYSVVINEGWMIKIIKQKLKIRYLYLKLNVK